MKKLLALFAAVAMTAANGMAGDPAAKPRLLAIPVNGANAGCCTSAVKEALEGLPGVVAVRMESADGAKVAIVTLDEKAELRLSEIVQVLDQAAEEMAGMMGSGISYKVNRDRLSLGEGSLVVPSEKTDEKALAGVQGVAKADVEPFGDGVGLRLHLAPKAVVALAPVDAAMKRAGAEVADVVLASNFDPSTAARPQQKPPAQNPPKGGGGGGGG